MFCPVCGIEGTAGLKYCKRCGATLGQPESTPARRIDYGKIAGMFWAVAVFGIVSIGTLIGCMIPLTVFHAGAGIIMPIMAFGSAAIITISVLLIRQLSRLIGLVEKEEPAAEVKKPATSRQYNAPQIAAEPRSVSSVTEHTTRTFDPAYRDSQSER
jgi:predicted lipid-binding transport protein (Tim44 family)